MRLSAEVARYLEGLVLGQGIRAGHQFRVLGWQRKFLQVFNTDGDGAVSLGRGGGKSVFAAGLGCAAVDVGGPLVEQMGETLVIAKTFSQAHSGIFRHVLRFLQPSFDRYGKGPRGRFRVQDSMNRAVVEDRETGAMLKLLGMNPGAIHGAQPKLFVMDESAQYDVNKREEVVAAVRTSRGKIPGSKVLWIGTRPDDPDHPFERALRGRGTAVSLSYQADKEDSPHRKATWLKANPSLRYPEFAELEKVIRAESEAARHDSALMAEFKSLRLNQGVGPVQLELFVTAEDWREAMAIGRPEQPRGPYVLGIDAGSSDSMSAFAAYHRDGSLDCFAVLPRHPDLKVKGLRDGVGNLYTRMSARGEVIQRGRRVADLGAGLEEVLERWGRPACIVVDSWRYADVRQAAEEVRFPHVEIVKRRGGFFDGHQDVVAARKAILSGLVRPPESLLLTSALAEARLVHDNSGNSKLASKSEGGRRRRAKDDACSASVLAIAVGYRAWHGGAPSRPLRYFRVPART